MNNRSIFYKENLILNKGGKELFTGKNISVNQREKIALIGNNGCGKSTLLRYIHKNSNDRSYFVEQIPSQYDKSLKLYELIQKDIDNWWDVIIYIEKNHRIYLTGEENVKNLSGGEYTIIKLAIAFLIDKELILLDEPTNHLDLYNKKIIIDKLHELNKTLIIVTHDEYLLKQHANTIWYIYKNQLIKFYGNYDDFLLQQEREEKALLDKLELNRKKQKKLQSTKQKEQNRLIKVNKQAKKAKIKNTVPPIQQGYFKNKADISKGKNSVLIEEKENEIYNELIDLKEKNHKNKEIKINWSSQKNKHTVLRIENIDIKTNKKNKKTLINDVNLSVSSGDKIAIIGRNGSGKSTLLKEIIKNKYIYSTQKKVYIDQNYSILEPEELVYNLLYKSSKSPNDTTIKKIASDYNLLSNLHNKIKILSGGERIRLLFAYIQVNTPELIILDEPTNHLDLESQRVFINLLSKTNASIIIVTHNIELLKSFDKNSIYEIENKVIRRGALSLQF